VLLCAAAFICTAACAAAPPNHALVVRHPERKCALIRFSGCALLFPEAQGAPAADSDGGVETPAHRPARELGGTRVLTRTR
jgi:hypothetical protein